MLIALLDGMKRIAVIAAILVAAPVYGQNILPAPQGWSLSLFGGGAAFTDFQRSTVQAVAPASDGGFERHDFPRRVSAKTASTFAAAVSYWPKQSSWGLRLFGSYAPSRFETLITEHDAALLKVPQSSEETQALAPLSIVSADLQVLVRLPAIRRLILPYTFVGGGIVRYSTPPSEAPMPEEADPDFASGVQIKPAGRLGVGAAVPLGNQNWRLHFELNDQIAPTPLRRGGDRSVNVTNAVAFLVGISFSP